MRRSKAFFVALILFAPILQFPLAIGDPGWLTGWQYRKTHTITGSTEGALTDYQVGIKIYFGSGTDGTEVVDGVTFGKRYLDSKCQVDFDDIRFTNSSGEDLLSYFIEEKTDSNNATFWVKVDSIPISPNSINIYIYYGNPDVSTTSDGNVTFPWLFDDFDDYEINDAPNVVDWTTSGTDGSNTIKVAADPDDAGQKCFAIVEDGAGVNTDLNGLLKADRTGVALRFRMRSTDHHWYIHWWEDAAVRASLNRDKDDDRMEWYDGDSYEQFDPVVTFTAATWYVIENQLMDTGEDYLHWLQDGTDSTGNFRATPTDGVNIFRFNPYRLEAQTNWIGGVGTDGRYIFARNFVDPEPTHTAWGSEEVQLLFVPTKLFGAGFNTSSPYVDLYWTSNLTDIDFFEVQNSTDNVSWDYLGSNTTAEYHDFQVVNGTERYYQVRACNYTGVFWINSTFTDTNFETVYFVEAAEGDTIIMGGSGVFWIILIIMVPIVAYMVNKK